MNRLAVAALLAALAAPASAQYPAGTRIPYDHPIVFTTIDAVQLFDGRWYVTGVVEGEPSASTWYASFAITTSEVGVQNLESCQRSALAVMDRPGRYRLEILQGAAIPASTTCKLVRVNP